MRYRIVKGVNGAGREMFMPQMAPDFWPWWPFWEDMAFNPFETERGAQFCIDRAKQHDFVNKEVIKYD